MVTGPEAFQKWVHRCPPSCLKTRGSSRWIGERSRNWSKIFGSQLRRWRTSGTNCRGTGHRQPASLNPFPVAVQAGLNAGHRGPSTRNAAEQPQEARRGQALAREGIAERWREARVRGATLARWRGGAGEPLSGGADACGGAGGEVAGWWRKVRCLAVRQRGMSEPSELLASFPEGTSCQYYGVHLLHGGCIFCTPLRAAHADRLSLPRRRVGPGLPALVVCSSIRQGARPTRPLRGVVARGPFELWRVGGAQ